MLKSKVNEYLGKNVIVILNTDNSEYCGKLQKGAGYEEGYYHCTGKRDNHWFRSSHIKKIISLGGKVDEKFIVR